MKTSFYIIALFSFLLFGCNRQCSQTPLSPWIEGAFETQEYRNLFNEIGYSEKEIDEKLAEIFHERYPELRLVAKLKRGVIK